MPIGEAFAPEDGALLVLKIVNGDKCVPDLEALRLAVADRSDIMVIDEYYDAKRLAALMNAADCYVSLHRSEGFGLTMAESMALGKPVIATAYSGNMDFMSPETAYLVSWTKGSVPPDCAPYPVGALWAEPDLDEAARLLRRVFEHPDEAAEVGRRGQRAVESRHGPEQRAAFVRERFNAIEAQRANALACSGHSTARSEVTDRAGGVSTAAGCDRHEVPRPGPLLPAGGAPGPAAP